MVVAPRLATLPAQQTWAPARRSTVRNMTGGQNLLTILALFFPWFRKTKPTPAPVLWVRLNIPRSLVFRQPTDLVVRE